MGSVTEIDRKLQRRRNRAAIIGAANRGCRRRYQKRSQASARCDSPAQSVVETASRLLVGATRPLLVFL